MRRAWVVRSGDTSREIDALRTAGLVGVRFEAVGDVRRLTPREVEHAFARSGATGIETLRSRLMRFVTDLRVGDLVVVPNLAEHDVWVAIVTGPYEYVDEPPVAGIHHTRSAEWQGWIDRSASWLQHKLAALDAPGAVVELRDPDWWFDQIGSRDLPAERPPRAFRPPPPAPASRATRGPRAPSAPRAPRAPRPAPEPARPKAPERVLCAGMCGLQWSPQVLVGGLCPDCRGD